MRTDHLIAKVSDRFRLGYPVEWELLQGGEDNLNVRVESTHAGTIVIRRYNDATIARVKYELDLIDYLHRRGYPTPAPLRSPHSKTFILIGERPISVFPFVRGHHPYRITHDLLVATGAVAADLHRLTAERPSRVARPHSWRTYLQKLRSVIRQPARPIAGWERFRETVKTYVTGNARVFELLRRLPSGDIHHDLRVANLILDRDNRISAVLDFGECQYGPFALELARIWQSMCVDKRTRMVDEAKAESLLSGYSARQRLDVRQRAAIPDFFQLANLVDAADYLLKISPRDCPTIGHCLSLRAFEANANASGGVLRTSRRPATAFGKTRAKAR